MHHMKWLGLCLFTAILALSCGAAEPTDGFTFEQGLDAKLNGKTWLRTVTTPFDVANPELNYKVYTHIYDFDGAFPITKGAGGKYSHHRGLFIGWKTTRLKDDTVDTWHMRTGRKKDGRDVFVHQQLAEWTALEGTADRASQTARILWAAEDMDPFIEEERTITTYPGQKGMRIIDFTSELKTLAGPIKLQGDPHHAGMQIRMSNEVVDNEKDTVYILPDGATRIENDNVKGAWWACGNMVIGGKQYSVMHLTPPDLVTGQPIYSARPYGRFGAFFEPDLTPEAPLAVKFRIIVSESPLDRETCEELYSQYSEEIKGNS